MLMLETNIPSITSTWSQSASRTRWTSRPRLAKSAERMEGAIVIMTHHSFLVSRWLDRAPARAHMVRLPHRIRQAAAGSPSPPRSTGPPSVFPYATDRPRRRRPGSPPHHIAFGTGAGSAGLFCPAGRPVPIGAETPGAPPQTVLGPWGPRASPPWSGHSAAAGRFSGPAVSILSAFFLPVNGKQSLTGLLSAGKML